MKRMIGLLTLFVCLIPTTAIGQSKGLQRTFEVKRASFSDLYDSFENQIKKDSSTSIPYSKTLSEKSHRSRLIREAAKHPL
jgi:hypothetical protein